MYCNICKKEVRDVFLAFIDRKNPNLKGQVCNQCIKKGNYIILGKVKNI